MWSATMESTRAKQRMTTGDSVARLLDRRIADDETVERARGCLGGRVVAHHAPGASRASLDVGDLVGGLCSGGIGFPRPWRQRGCSCKLPPRSLVRGDAKEGGEVPGALGSAWRRPARYGCGEGLDGHGGALGREKGGAS